MKCKLMATFPVVLGFFVLASSALANPSSVKDCSVCQFKPAIPTTTTTKSSSATSQTHIHAVTTLKAQTHQYEQVKHRIVAINIKPGGVSSLKGCVDPVQRGWITPGGQFKNSRLNGGQFWDTWQAGRMICRAQRIKIGNTFWMRGWKDNCGNEIWIQVAGPRTIHKIIPVVVFRTVKTFRKSYDELITKKTTSTSTGTTTTTYSCDAYGSGWTLTTERGANECKLCPPTPCPTPTPPPPPSKAHAWLSKTAIKDGSTVALVGGEFTFSVSVNGGSSTSTTNVASGSSRDLGQFNPGDSVQVCETNSGGYTPDQVCITHTMAAGENYTFSFVNRKTTPPPSHYTQISCTWQEEITGGGSSLVVCNAQDDNGAEIDLYAQSQDSNSQVSGINCYSQGGSPSCNGNGTFQFRVDGFNNGSAPVTTTIIVYAMANGVKSNQVTITINVDPSSNGFTNTVRR